MVHPKLCDGDTETTIKLAFEGTETIQEIAEVINRRIKEETTDRQGENGTDKLAKVLTFVPAPLIRLVVNTLMWMDRHNLLPKAIIDLSPFHTSFFITNLKSLGINYIFHHTYEFGTTGLFFAIGNEQNHVVLDKSGNPKVGLHLEHHMQWTMKKYRRTREEPLPTITPHVLRHTFCTNMANAGMELKSLQYLMGHSDAGITMNVYTHTTFTQAEQSMQKILKFEPKQEAKTG